MGEVYRARDTNLGRQIAIKVLPDAFAHDPERLARFEREAKALAALNHPNIAQIYGFERADGVRALVMELIEGPKLADRIARGALPFDDAVSVATQIVEALDCAHQNGVLHRDLKPANIKVTLEGRVKVLDFGLAKAIAGAGGSEDALGPQADSPTVTSSALTIRGAILGTVAYMSPEQARGTAVDKRADNWAFGCVLYEMLTGARAFHGETVSDTLAAVITSDPDWTKLPPSVSGPVRQLLQCCLARDPRERLRDIADARLLLSTAVPLSAAVAIR